MTVPAAVFLATLSGLVGDAVFFGEDQAVGAALVAAALVGLAPGIVGEASFVLSTQASYATDDARGPFRAMAVRTALSFGGVMTAAFALDSPAAVLACLGAAFSLGNIVGALRLWRQLRSRVGRTRPATVRIVARDLVASALMAAVALLVGVAIATAFGGEAGEILASSRRSSRVGSSFSPSGRSGLPNSLSSPGGSGSCGSVGSHESPTACTRACLTSRPAAQSSRSLARPTFRRSLAP